MNAVRCPLQFPVFMSYSMSPSSTFTPSNPRPSAKPRWRKCQHLLCCNSFRFAEQVTCHNSGKSLWLDLQANSWHCMVEWQRLMLTLSTQQQQKPQLSTNASCFFHQGIRILWVTSPFATNGICCDTGYRLHPPPRRLWKAGEKKTAHMRRDVSEMYSCCGCDAKETLWQFAHLYVPTTRCKARIAILGIPLQWSCLMRGVVFLASPRLSPPPTASLC